MNILITGATSGIGLELTKHLSKKHKIYALGRNEQKLTELESNTHVTPIKADVSNFSEVSEALSKIKNLDVLINCAGILWPVGKLEENSMDEWKQNILTNLVGTANCCRAGLKKFRGGKGKVINFAGGGSTYGRAFHTAYSSAKAGVVRFTESLAQEYPNLDINVISPGRHKTNLWKSETHDKPTEFGDMNQLKRFVEFLISDKSNGITGRFLHYKDAWQKIDSKNLPEDLYTLRRVEPKS